MQVFLEAIKFNYDPTFKTTGTFNIRRNETRTVAVPEWRVNSCINHECSPVAYATSKVPNTVTIQASFTCDDVSMTSVSVQALSDPSVVQLGLSAANVLGDIPVHEIPLKQGRSGYVPLTLTNAKLREAAIDIHDVTWHWQFSQDSVNWTDFQTTKHRIYTVSEMPSLPWEPQSSEPSNIHVPWTEVLDYACSWAAGVKDDRAEAASRITHCVYTLGTTLVKYGEGPSYAYGKFNCTNFLKLLTGIGGNQTLNCDDCATIVSTFANILGCDLSQSGMGLGFNTNPILLIGDSEWKPEWFLHHCVAWNGDAGKSDTLFDSCLRVDGEGPPDCQPHVPHQPVNVPFGDWNDKEYKYRLVEANNACVPIPTDGRYGQRRRQFGAGHLADSEILENEFLDKLRVLYDFDKWPSVKQFDIASGRKLVTQSQLESAFSNWRLYEYQHLQNHKFANIVLTIFQPVEPEAEERLAMNLYECGESSEPNEVLLQVLGMFDRRLRRSENLAIGELAFQASGERAVLFRSNRFIAVLRSTGRRSFSVLEFARVLDEYLVTET